MGARNSKTAPAVDARYLAPQKLYCYSEVDLRKLRRLIKDRKLAPCYFGVDSDSEQDCRELDECPICFLKFPSINRAVCCHKPICTECFLQVKSLQAGNCPKCPFCKADFAIYYHGEKTAEQRLQSIDEEEQHLQAAIRSRQGEQCQAEQSNTPQSQAASSTAAGRSSAQAGSQQTKWSQAQVADFMDQHIPGMSTMLDVMDDDMDLNDIMLMQGISASLQDQAHPTAAVPPALMSAVQALDAPCLIPPAVLDTAPATCSQAQPWSVSNMHQSLQEIGALCRPSTPGTIVAASFRPHASSTAAATVVAAPSATVPPLLRSPPASAPAPAAPAPVPAPAPAAPRSSNTASSSSPSPLSSAVVASAAQSLLHKTDTAVTFIPKHPDEHVQVFAYHFPQANSQASTPHASTPQASTPQASTPHASTPQASTPHASNPQASTPHASTPQASIPHASTPPASTPQDGSLDADHAPVVTGLSPSPSSSGSMGGIQAARLSGVGSTRQSSAGKAMHASSSGRKPFASLLQAARDIPRAASQKKRSSAAPAGDSFAGFLHQQATAGQWPLGHSQNALWPEPSSLQAGHFGTCPPGQFPPGSHDLTVGMVLTESKFTSNPTPDPFGPAPEHQSRPSAASSSLLSSHGSSATQPAADQAGSSTAGHQDPALAPSTGSQLGPGSGSTSDSLAGGAVLLQNPDGSTQYVLLTSEDQIAVQLSLKAQQARLAQQAGRAESYQEECTPEDQALQDKIARGDEILQRLYAAHDSRNTEAAPSPASAQDQPQSPAHGMPDHHNDAMMKRMEAADARLKALYSQ